MVRNIVCKSFVYRALGRLRERVDSSGGERLYYASAGELCRHSSAVEQQSCKLLVPGSIPGAGSRHGSKPQAPHPVAVALRREPRRAHIDKEPSPLTEEHASRCDTGEGHAAARASLEVWPSGQRQQTVNLSGFALRWFESIRLHQPLASPFLLPLLDSFVRHISRHGGPTTRQALDLC